MLHVQQDYFSSFDQSDYCFPTSSLPLLLSLLQINSSLQLLTYTFINYDAIVRLTVSICRWHFIRSRCYDSYQKRQLFTSTDLSTCVFGVTKILIESLQDPSCSKGGYNAIHWITRRVLVVFIRWIAQSILWPTGPGRVKEGQYHLN